MKTIGMIGGMSWESTVSYYRAINEGVKKKLGGLNSAKISMCSVNFDEIAKLQHQGEWDKTAEILTQAAKSVESGGADFLMICTNTMHKVAPQIESSLTIPLLHIADATAEQLQHDGIIKVGLIGTKFTMEQDFYKGRLTDKFGIDVVVPDERQRQIIHDVIFQELCQGNIVEESRREYLDIIVDLSKKGAQAVILGCTEIALLIRPEHTDVRLYDTTTVHAQAAVEMAIA